MFMENIERMLKRSGSGSTEGVSLPWLCIYSYSVLSAYHWQSFPSSSFSYDTDVHTNPSESVTSVVAEHRL